jgi:plasmid stabilization system protein ParE
VLILEDHPEIGRPAGKGSSLRELVISHGKSGYLALYEYSPAEQLIRVLAVRHQREAGYRGR